MRLKLLAILLASASLQACVNPVGLVMPIPHSSEPIRGTVVDSNTQQPLDGVVVIAGWKDETPSFEITIEGRPPPSCENTISFESVTSDKAGHFELPAWSQWGHCAQMASYSPQIYFYRPGYRLLALHNNSADDFDFEHSDPSSTNTDGRTIKLQPIGPHYFDGQADDQVTELIHYSDVLNNFLVISNRHPRRCFWQEARPAVLMLLMEERRLSGYGINGFQFFNDELSHPSEVFGGEWSCGSQQPYLQTLAAQAQRVQPEVAVEPRVANESERDPFAPKSIRLEQEGVTEDPGSAEFAKTGIIYHVNVDPRNPTYLRVTMVLPPVREVEFQYVLTSANQQTLRQQMGYQNYDYVCGSFRGALACQWLTAIEAVSEGRASNLPSYDFLSHTWRLNSSMFVRPLVDADEYVEIDGPDSLIVMTSLVHVAPHLWQLTAHGSTFGIQVHESN